MHSSGGEFHVDPEFKDSLSGRLALRIDSAFLAVDLADAGRR
jgi:hypothetical protein